MAKAPKTPAIAWVATGLGRRVLAEETPLLTEMVRRCHGDTLLWSGPAPEAAAGVKRCMVRDCFYMAPLGIPASCDLACFRGCLSALPLPRHCADGFVLHHSLELEPDPRQALREVSRVIAPGGRLLVCAFNGWSLWGLRALYGRLHADLFSGMRFVNPLRLADWLALLGFEMDGPTVHLGYGAPFGGNWNPENKLGGWLRRAQPPAGGMLLISAFKQSRGARRVGRRRAFRSAPLAPAAYPKPTAWNPVERSR